MEDNRGSLCPSNVSVPGKTTFPPPPLFFVSIFSGTYQKKPKNARMVSFCFAILNTNYLEPNDSMDVGQALPPPPGEIPHTKRRHSAAAERWKSQIHR